MRGVRWAAAAAAVGALTLGAASPAFAHECFIANRSAQGSEQATHSDRWFQVQVFDFLVDTPPDGLGFTPECAAGAVEAIADAGLPTSFAVRSDKTIGEGSNNPNTGNGKGLEHLEDSPIANDVIGAAFGYAAANCD